MTADLRIDRISIRAPGLGPDAARNLGELVAERLAPPLRLGSADAVFDRLRVAVTATSGESSEALAERIGVRVAGLVNAASMEAGR